MIFSVGSIVYALCSLTSIACAVLLLRGYRRSRVRLLLWSGLCFAGLALNNVLLFIDVRVVPDVDLSLWRTIPAVIGIAILLFGLIWETSR
jgi:heme/copper-type cytochrome/quinol oxidase subunit 4